MNVAAVKRLVCIAIFHFDLYGQVLPNDRRPGSSKDRKENYDSGSFVITRYYTDSMEFLLHIIILMAV